MKFSLNDNYLNLGLIVSINSDIPSVKIRGNTIVIAPNVSVKTTEQARNYITDTYSVMGFGDWEVPTRLESLTASGFLFNDFGSIQGFSYLSLPMVTNEFLETNSFVQKGLEYPELGGYCFHVENNEAYIFTNFEQLSSWNDLETNVGNLSYSVEGNVFSDYLPMPADIYSNFKTVLFDTGKVSLNTNLRHWTGSSHVRNLAFYANPVTGGVFTASKADVYNVLAYRKVPYNSGLTRYDRLVSPQTSEYYKATEELDINFAYFAAKKFSVVEHILSDVSGFNIATEFKADPIIGENFCSRGNINLPNIFASTSTCNIEAPEEVFEMSFPVGWYMFSLPFNISSLTKITYNNQDTTFSASDFISATQFGETYNSIPMNTLLAGPYSDDAVIIVKDYAGEVEVPEFNYFGLDFVSKHEGYQIKSSSAFTITFHATPDYNVLCTNNIGTLEYDSIVKIPSGWGIIRFPLTEKLNIFLALESIIDDVVIVKDYKGSAYLPEFGYDGIGHFTPGQSYQIKMKTTKSYYDVKFIAGA